MENITKKYKKYILKPSNENIKQICQPSKFQLQPQQKFLPEYLYDNKNTITSHTITSHAITSHAIRNDTKTNNKPRKLVENIYYF